MVNLHYILDATDIACKTISSSLK